MSLFIRTEEATMEGYHFPLSLAMACMSCGACFQMQRACPACTSDHIEAIETFLTRRRAQEFEATTVRELERAGAIKAWRIVGLKKEPYQAAS